MSKETIEKGQKFVRCVDPVINFVHQHLTFSECAVAKAFVLHGVFKNAIAAPELPQSLHKKLRMFPAFLDYLTGKGVGFS